MDRVDSLTKNFGLNFLTLVKFSIIYPKHGWHDSARAGWIQNSRNYFGNKEDLTFMILDWSHEADSINYFQVKSSNITSNIFPWSF